MQLFKEIPSFNFMGQRRSALWLSAVLIAISIGSLVTRGLNWGPDFTGGVLLEVVYDQGVQLEDVRAALATLLVLVALLSLAGETLFGFSIALIVGIIVGTYSSIYIGGAAILHLNVVPADMVPQKREELDELP